MRRRDGGYMDPIMSVLPLAFLAVVIGVPALVRFALSRSPGSPGAWARIALGTGVILVLQAVAIGIALEEARHDAFSGGQRSGLNRAPVFQGLLAPFAVAAIYLVGMWPLSRIDGAPSWLLFSLAGAAAAVIVAGLVAHRLGSRARRRTDRRDSPPRHQPSP